MSDPSLSRKLGIVIKSCASGASNLAVLACVFAGQAEFAYSQALPVDKGSQANTVQAVAIPNGQAVDVPNGQAVAVPSGQAVDVPKERSIIANSVKSEALTRCIKKAEEYKTVQGSPPGVGFYYSSVANLDRSEASMLFGHIIQQQNPRISLDELVLLFEAMRDSISSFRCEYTHSAQPGVNHVFAFDDNKLYIQEPTKDNEGRLASAVTSYDGELFQRVVSLADDGLDPQAHVSSDNALSSFYRPLMPLCSAMLFDMQRTGAAPSLSDFSKYAKMACVVYEESKVIDGVECLLVSDGAADIYLDISRNFAVLRMDNFIIDRDNDDGANRITGRHLIRRIEHSEFADVGNSVWLPRKIRITSYGPAETPGGKPTELGQDVISVLKLEVNPELEETLFSDIIPDEAHVANEVLGLAYRQGMRDSINGMVRREVMPKRGRFLFVTLNAIAIAAFAAVYAFRKMSEKKKSEPSADQ